MHAMGACQHPSLGTRSSISSAARQVAAATTAARQGHPSSVRAASRQQQHQQQQRPWQQALLESMQQHYLADLSSPPTGTTSSCTTLDTLLDEVYDSIDDIYFSKGGYVIPPRERKLIDATGGSSSYGEIQSAGVDQLLRYLAMDKDSVFVDLGCGRGRAVLQVAAKSTSVAACIGLELSDSRLEQAELALQQLQLGGRVPLAPVEFRSADLGTCDLQEGSHFYLCSTAFGAGICRSIAQRLAASPNFRVLVTSRQLPTQPHLYKVVEAPCAFSFSAHGRAYVYVKSLVEAPPALLARHWCGHGVCWLPGVTPLQLVIAEDEPVGAAHQGDRFVTLPGGAAVAGQIAWQQPMQQQQQEE